MAKKKIVFTTPSVPDYTYDKRATGEVRVEDNGCFVSVCFHDNNPADNGLYVVLGSWYDGKEHTELKSFAGKKLKIILEISD